MQPTTRPPFSRFTYTYTRVTGIKEDIKRAKEEGRAYDPRGVGAAFTHNFLNLKPWHPMNFRNQARVYEAEQRAAAADKAREQALVSAPVGVGIRRE